MAQFLYPISDVTNTFASGGFADIDEASPSDTDFAYGTNNSTDTLECALTDTGITDPAVGTGHTVYWRQSQADSDAGTPAPSTGGSNATYDVLLIQGTTTIATCASGSSTNDGSFAAGSYTLTAGEADSITDYTDLRIRMVSIGTGGTPSGRRAAAFSSAYLEIPDAATSWDLVVNDGTHSHSADAPTITHDYSVTVNDASHAHTADAPTFTSDYPLTVQDGTHAHAADQPTITTAYSLTVNDGTHAHTADNVVIAPDYPLTVQEGTHGHTADNVVITHSYTLVVNDGTHAHTADAPTVTTAYNLTVNEASHSHSADNVTVSYTPGGSVNLVVQEASHAHTADAPTITHSYSLTANEGTHSHSADNVAIQTSYTLVVADASHTHTADNVTVSATTGVVLTVQSGTHSHTADLVSITTNIPRFNLIDSPTAFGNKKFVGSGKMTNAVLSQKEFSDVISVGVKKNIIKSTKFK